MLVTGLKAKFKSTVLKGQVLKRHVLKRHVLKRQCNALVDFYQLYVDSSALNYQLC